MLDPSAASALACAKAVESGGEGKQIRQVNRLWVACDFEMPALPLPGLD